MHCSFQVCQNFIEENYRNNVYRSQKYRKTPTCISYIHTPSKFSEQHAKLIALQFKFIQTTAAILVKIVRKSRNYEKLSNHTNFSQLSLVIAKNASHISFYVNVNARRDKNFVECLTDQYIEQLYNVYTDIYIQYIWSTSTSPTKFRESFTFIIMLYILREM